MIPFSAILAEIRAAGPCPEPEGERLTVKDFNTLVAYGSGSYTLVSTAIRQLRADLARLAADVERQNSVIQRLSNVVAWAEQFARERDEKAFEEGFQRENVENGR